MKSGAKFSRRPDVLAKPTPGFLQRAPSVSSRAGYLVLATVVAPIFLLVAAWRTNSAKYRHWLLTAFVTMYGATIIIQYDPSGKGADGVRHLQMVYEHYTFMSFSQFLEDIWSVMTFQDASHPGIRDLYKHLVSYLVGGVLGLPALFFTVIAFVYGYFFTGSFIEIFKHVRWRKANYVVLAFIFLLFLVKNIEGVNTVRTWTGLWVLMYGCLRYYDTKNKKYIFLMLLPPFIHFGYFLMVLPAVAVLLFGNRPKIYGILFVVSSLTTVFNPGDVTDIVDIIESTERGADAVQAYMLEEKQTWGELRDWVSNDIGGRWYRQFQFLGIQKWALNLLIYVLLAGGIYRYVMNYRQRTLFSIGLVTLAFSNMTWFLYAVSNRSWIIGCVFVLSSFVMTRVDPVTAPRLLRTVPSYYSLGVHFSLILFVPYILYNMSILVDYISLFMFVAPFLVWIDPEMNMSIKYALQVILGIR